MPTYPSSLYKADRPSTLGSNVTGSITRSNITNYQELVDIVNGAGDVSIAYNSAAKYPTDTNIGTEVITNRTRTITDVLKLDDTYTKGAARDIIDSIKFKMELFKMSISEVESLKDSTIQRLI